ncbi:pyridoxamine 5'-phosphate oxidase family protein [Pedobacter nototheniae]|uniref:pyridoxamine 5'-phosphate oxidase family protein n=1 Tax=Pedobacter nototheniae TaxID=2488994 RepID=UPI00292FCC5E|nr:pyridoxamine 5'-phosphate oxidase family protein [Pedobacter nototheniae]
METSQEGSTNNTQEENIKDLGGKEAIEKLRGLAEKAESCFFCTNIKIGLPLSVRPMAMQEVDDEGNIWFMSMKDSTKNDEIAADPFTHLLFQAGAHSGFVNIYGIAEISRDQEMIDKLWSPFIKTWFQGGKDDPNITLIKVIPSEGYYWDTKHGTAVAFLKIAASVIMGKTMDDSVEGTLDID